MIVRPVANLSPNKLSQLVHQIFGPFWSTLPVTFVPIKLAVVFHLGLPTAPPPCWPSWLAIADANEKSWQLITHIFSPCWSRVNADNALPSHGIPCLWRLLFSSIGRVSARVFIHKQVNQRERVLLYIYVFIHLWYFFIFFIVCLLILIII
jgi:hypothetical protein